MLETISEQSGFRLTGRYEEVGPLCDAFAATYPDSVRCVEFGRSPEGRTMLALVVTKSGALEPRQAREKGIPVMLAQAGIHAGEIDGKDAGFLAIRELLEDKQAVRTLESTVLVFIPVLSVDGHERFGRWNRPNQNGPEEMGWRTTAQNLNLNRDYTKVDARETRALLRLLDAWDPILYVDLHVTDGAQFEHDVANLVEPRYSGDPGLQPAGRALLRELNEKLTAQG
jgi:murein tripeptide amidase MpaA